MGTLGPPEIPWTFHEMSVTGKTIPMVVHVESPHHPDGVYAGHCVECLEAWPCQFWRSLRATVVTIMNIPPEDLLTFSREKLEDLAQQIAEIEQGGGTPVSFQAAKIRRGNNDPR